MYIYIYVCMYVYMYIHTYIHTYMSITIYLSIYLSIYPSTHIPNTGENVDGLIEEDAEHTTHSAYTRKQQYLPPVNRRDHREPVCR